MCAKFHIISFKTSFPMKVKNIRSNDVCMYTFFSSYGPQPKPQSLIHRSNVFIHFKYLGSIFAKLLQQTPKLSRIVTGFIQLSSSVRRSCIPKQFTRLSTNVSIGNSIFFRSCSNKTTLEAASVPLRSDAFRR
jgi:hypothetical protein